MKVLENSNGTDILLVNDETTKMLDDKHPKAEDHKENMILQGPITYIDPVNMKK